MLFSLLRQFFLLIVFRAGPQDLLATNQALYIAAGFNALVGFLVARSVDGGLETALGPAAEVAVELVLLAVYVGLWVWIREVPSRFLQTLTAAYGVNGMVTLIAWPLLVASPPMEEIGTVQPGALAFLILTIIMWNLMALQCFSSCAEHGTAIRLSVGFHLFSYCWFYRDLFL
ncbi:MAG TPA: hypothetical protein ENN02_00335 [Halothiobacillus sp.]|nr:hypothetical protein [Halothiobacillus sp.]